ncbi:glycine--tRNA ligase [Candidatus Saccharibacteria bacterium RIFCSPHIGHO2_12_FULL_41_12]|nr:MAG: glycine--tRNA ligase [Candidatus Saccharibacteria bacterium RIFCSPHIGHO2_12_FULL_41_12]
MSKENKEKVSMDSIVSLCKRRGFIYQGSEVYGGLSGTWDYGPLGVTLKRNIQNLWWKTFVEDRDDMYGVDAAILMNQKVWQASGHVDTFTDPLVECKNCKSRFRADHLEGDKCPTCGKEGTFDEPMQFNMMFETRIGPFAGERGLILEKKVAQKYIDAMNKDKLEEVKITVDDLLHREVVGPNTTYLRPETAQGIFTNYKNVVDSFYPDVPFGIAQIGKAFRNEISPRDFVFRSREFEQMEIEYFVHKDEWKQEFEKWVKDIEVFLGQLGLPKESVHNLEVEEADRAHYSKRTIDFEFDFPHKRDELLGLAYRTDFDLMNIQKASGKNMEYRTKDGKESFVPHVIEPSFGVERLLMAVLVSAYTEDEINGEKRTYLKLPAHLAPVKVAVSPLLKNKPELVKKAQEVYKMLKKEYGNVMWDDNGNIGKRYRRQDEIGTPYCITIDFDTLEDNTVTIRDRDTAEQKRVKINDVNKDLSK